MQRKNSILKNNSHKSGIAMIMAIAVIVVVATILALSLSLTAQTSKKTTDLYLYEQATILSHSASEYAMLKISRVAPCSLDTLNYTYNNIYDISIDMHYISTAGSACETNANLGTKVGYGTVVNAATNGTVILDITVSVTNPTITSEPISYFRRSIQKL